MKYVIVTGISRGIGQALAEKFLEQGFFVIGTTTGDKAPLENSNLKVFNLDLSKAESIEKFADDVSLLNVKINILINNAGGLFDEEETKVIVEKLRKTLEVNLIGTIDLTERLVEKLDNNAHIVNVSSAAGSLEDTEHVEDSHYPYHYPAYKISKCALNMYTRTLALRMKNEGKTITVSSVHPGWVRTDMGGEEAPVLPSEAAQNIYNLAVSNPPTGHFWFNGKSYPW